MLLSLSCVQEWVVSHYTHGGHQYTQVIASSLSVLIPGTLAGLWICRYMRPMPFDLRECSIGSNKLNTASDTRKCTYLQPTG